jgi:hypothetical protein
MGSSGREGGGESRRGGVVEEGHKGDRRVHSRHGRGILVLLRQDVEDGKSIH